MLDPLDFNGCSATVRMVYDGWSRTNKYLVRSLPHPTPIRGGYMTISAKAVGLCALNLYPD